MMNQQQFQEEPSRSQRMTEDEAKAVIDLWQQECVETGGLTTSPAVQDVAEGLDISVADVQRLLQNVRTRRGAEDRRVVRGQPPRDLISQRLADEERHLTTVRQEWARMRRQSTPKRTQPVRTSPPVFGISPPSAEELAETTQTEARIKADESRFRGYLIAIIAAIAVLADFLASFSR